MLPAMLKALRRHSTILPLMSRMHSDLGLAVWRLLPALAGRQRDGSDAASHSGASQPGLSHGSPTADLMHQWITHESLSHEERVQTVPSACGEPASNGQSARPLGSFDVHHVRTIRRSVRSYSSARDSDSRLIVNGPGGRLHSGRT